MKRKKILKKRLINLRYEPKKKTYYKLLEEIKPQRLFNGLLGYGLFSDNIPPLFTGKNFLDFCKNPPPNFIFDNSPKKYIHYESMRNINVPRVLAIPNPIAYHNQCKALSDNWHELLKYFQEQTKSQKHKISRIHIRKIDNTFKLFNTCYEGETVTPSNKHQLKKTNPKHLFEMNHKNFCKDDYPEPNLLIRKK